MSSAKCPNCDAKVSAAEMSDGWCETCGKRLPSSAASGGGRAVAAASPYGRRRSGTKKVTFGGIVVLFVCMAISVAVTTIAMGKGPVPTAVGCGVGAVFGVLIGRMFGFMPTSDD
jgi:hypothetical protein